MFERNENGATMECPICGHVNTAEVKDEKFSRTYEFQCENCITVTSVSEYLEDGNPVFDIPYEEDESVMIAFGTPEALASLYEE